ncbi:MAG: MBL fold metallo-hydrolase, partial [Desulfobacterales bacterium]|nr:MBL fold metallo-hydrolase [Desulfobacterales bacterium]
MGIEYAGDTNFIPEMKKLGRVDLALLPIGGSFTMDLAEALRAAMAINPKVTIPMYRSKADPQDFKKKVEKRSNIKVET